MRRCYPILFLALFLMIPTSVGAIESFPHTVDEFPQQPPPGVENVTSPLTLGEVYLVEGLGIQFEYPAGWLPNTQQDITFTADPAEMPIATDGDPSTKPLSPFISMDFLPLAAVGLPMDADTEDAFKVINDVLALQIDEQYETGVLSKRAVTVLAADSNDDYGIITFWIQRDVVVVFIMSTPNADGAKSLLSDWETILTTLRPIQSPPLTLEVTSQFGNLAWQLPEGWHVFDGPDRFGAFASRNDYDLYQIGQFQLFEDVVITVLYQPVSDLMNAGLLTEPDDLDELLNLNMQFLNLQNPIVREGWALEGPAYSVEAPNGDGFYTYGVMGFVDDNVYYVQASGFNVQRVIDFKLIFDWIIANLEIR